tara:strand:- start:298 stop:1032 length:735 start_codon:yes stop_codon:yes gene_type:complete
MKAIFLTARLKSVRLKRKVLLEVNAIPIIQYLINRILKNTDIKIILCTSTNKQDDDLIDFARKISLEYYRGSEEDVLDRYYQTALNFNIDKFYIIYGDEPFIDIDLMLETFKNMDQNKSQFVDNSSYIDGTFGYGMTFKAISHVVKSKIFTDLEVWGDFVRSLGEIEVIPNVFEGNKSKVRLTIDYKEDFIVFQEILVYLKHTYMDCTIPNIVDVYLKNDLLRINGHRIDDYTKRIVLQASYEL